MNLPDITFIIAMCTFALTMSVTPGPVNIMILSTGLNYGLRPAMPFISGATTGFTLLLICIGSGLHSIASGHPVFMKCLTVSGAVFICYLGYKILCTTEQPEIAEQKRSVPTFTEGFCLQWLNPKAWIASLSGASLFSSPENNQLFMLFTLCYFIICYACLTFWAVMGQKVSTWLKQEKHLKRLNILMGGLLMFTAVYLISSQLNTTYSQI